MPAKPLPSFDEVREEEVRVAKAYARLFATPDGELVLKDLEQRFLAPTKVRPAPDLPIDPYQLAMNHGQVQAVTWIRGRMAFAEGENDG